MKKKIIFTFKIFLFLIIIYYAKDFFSKDQIYKILQKITIFDYIFATIIMIIISFVNSYRWYLIASEYKNVSFYNYFSNIILGLNLSQIFSTALAIDACKIYFIKNKLGYKKSILILIYDKLITLFFKICVIIIFLNFFNFFNYKFFNSLLLFVLSAMLMVIIYKSLNNHLLKKFSNFSILKKFDLIKFFVSICIRLKKKYKKIYFYNFIIQILITFIYIYIYFKLTNNIEFIKISLLVPITEISGQFQFFLLNAKEMFTIFIYSFANIEKETALVLAIVIKIVEILHSVILYFFTLFYKNEK